MKIVEARVWTPLERLESLGVKDEIDIFAIGVRGALLGRCSADGLRELCRDHARQYPEDSATAFAVMKALNEFAALGKVPTVAEARDRIVALSQS